MTENCNYNCSAASVAVQHDIALVLLRVALLDLEADFAEILTSSFPLLRSVDRELRKTAGEEIVKSISRMEAALESAAEEGGVR
jgi:hypothetical protein